MYPFLRVLHIFCASMTLALLPLSWWFLSYRAKVKNTPNELNVIQMEFGIGRFMGMIGGIGLLLTGGAMTGMAHYPWFDFVGFPWLAYKQMFYIIILIVNFAFMIPVAKKIMPLIAAQKGGGVTADIRALAGRAAMFGMIMNLLTVVNAVLGAVKPSL